VLGGGVAGMTAAHELIERGFDVEVYERRKVPGGKARSVKAPGSAIGGGQPLPGEHGFRFFPGFYKHVPDTMKRIPYGGQRRGVLDNLVTTSRIEIIRGGMQPIVLPARLPRSRADLDVLLHARGQFERLGVPAEDIAFYKERLWQVLTSCEARRLDEYEKLGWWYFIGADRRSEAYQQFMAEGMTRSLVAAQAKTASTRTNGDILLQLLFNLVEPGVGADRVLNGPTNEVWIGPWLEHLTRAGVRYHTDARVLALECAKGAITGAVVEMADGGLHQVTADYYVAALPVEVMARLLSVPITDADSTLEGLKVLADDTAWMNGIQFYLTEDLPLEHGHQIYIDSKWALTSLSQRQFWPHTDFSAFADGGVRGILSVDISDWTTKGFNGKTALECAKQEIADEVWLQLKAGLNTGGRAVLEDAQRYAKYPWFLDDDIHVKDGPHDVTTNLEPLLVNKAGTWDLRPDPYTRLPNLFLAADYVRTSTDLATMEGADEAARRAVNAIVDASGVRAPSCTLWKLHEPLAFALWRWHDRRRYERGLPWSEHVPWLVGAAQRVVAALVSLARR